MIPRRRLLFGGNPITAIINAFKVRVAGDGGTFEAESCLNATITKLKNINLYDSASLIVTPNANKSAKFYGVKPTDGSGDLTFSRANSAMRRNSAGLWESVASGLPRLHYPVGGGCPSWLFEPQSTCLIPSCNIFTGNTVKTTGITDSPINGVTSVRLTKDSAGVQYAVTTYSATIVSATNYAPSLYFKYDGHDIDSSLEFNNGNDWGKAWKVNIEIRSTGITIVLQNDCTAVLVAETNGWYRLEVSLTTATVTTNTASYLIKAAGANGASFLVCTSNLTQTARAIAPIITTGSNVTKIVDIATTASKSKLTNTSFTLVMKLKSGFNQSSGNPYLGIEDGFFVDGVYLMSSSTGNGNRWRANVRRSNVSIEILADSLGLLIAGQTIVIKVDGSQVKVFLAGSLITTNTLAGSLPLLPNVYASAGGMASLLDLFIAVDSAVSDTECVNLSNL